MTKNQATQTIEDENIEALLICLIEKTKGIIDIHERENNAIALKNDIQFYEISADKKRLNKEFAAKVHELKKRSEELDRYDGVYLEELKALEKSLKSSILINMGLLSGIIPKH